MDVLTPYQRHKVETEFRMYRYVHGANIEAWVKSLTHSEQVYLHRLLGEQIETWRPTLERLATWAEDAGLIATECHAEPRAAGQVLGGRGPA